MITTVNSTYEKEAIPQSLVHSHGGAAASYVLLTSSGFVKQLVVTNATANARFVQIHDAVSLPADTSVPVFSVPIAASSTVTIDVPIFVGTGAVVALSSTMATLTISADTAMFYANVRN